MKDKHHTKGRFHGQTQEIWNELSGEASSNTKPDIAADTRSEEDFSLEQLREVTIALERYTIEIPTLEDSKQLMKALSARYPSRAGSSNPNAGGELDIRSRKVNTWGHLLIIMRVVRSQTRLFSVSFWLLTAFLILLAGWSGVFVKEGMTHPLVFIVPAIAALSVCMAFRSYGTPMFLLEMSFPISPAQMIYGRLLFILGYDVLLALAASLFVEPSANELGTLVMNWLLPLGVASMTALAASLYMRLVNAIISSLLVWSVQIVLNDQLGVFYFLGGGHQENRAMSMLTGCLLILGLMALVHRKIARMKQPGGV